MRWLTLTFVLTIPPAWSQEFPSSYLVTGVADDDALNIRSTPDTRSEVVGEYDPYTSHIEVLRTSPDGKSGLVGVGEGNGWVSMQYLTLSDHQDPNAFPRPMTCFGTEPFWSLNVTARGDEYQEMGDERRDMQMISDRVASNGAIAVFEEGPTLNRTLIVMRGYCGDGMSDREYGWTATLFNDAPDTASVQTGCCTLDMAN